LFVIRRGHKYKAEDRTVVSIDDDGGLRRHWAILGSHAKIATYPHLDVLSLAGLLIPE
jgi:hypothetical protein